MANYPYTDYHTLNLDWVIAEIRKLQAGVLTVDDILNELGEARDKAVSQKAVTDELDKKFDKVNVTDLQGSSSEKVMSQIGVTAGLNGKVEKSAIKQTLGQSVDDIMSQKAVTDEIEKKFDKVNIDEDIISPLSRDRVPSSKAVSDVTDQLVAKDDVSEVIDPDSATTNATSDLAVFTYAMPMPREMSTNIQASVGGVSFTALPDVGARLMEFDAKITGLSSGGLGIKFKKAGGVVYDFTTFAVTILGISTTAKDIYFKIEPIERNGSFTTFAITATSNTGSARTTIQVANVTSIPEIEVYTVNGVVVNTPQMIVRYVK